MHVPLVSPALRDATRRTLHRFRIRLERYRLANPRAVRAQLLDDPAIASAIEAHCHTHHMSPAQGRSLVERYLREIVPSFNVLVYYRVGYHAARALLRLLYRVSVSYQDRPALETLPRSDVAVYLINHRSNADYVVVAFALARGVSLSYAVGEWARVWPLDALFKRFGAYFVRRRYPEPLYHRVLERYVQHITRHGVTQGIFLEGGLSRDGTLMPPKLGLLDYLAGTLREPSFEQDIRLVPVALNYDRVLEDRILIHERLSGGTPEARPVPLRTLTARAAVNLGRLILGRRLRCGRVAVHFGTPISLRTWAEKHPGVLDLPRAERLACLQALAQEIMGRIAALMPVTPVPFVAAGLLSFGRDLVRLDDLLERLDHYRDHLVMANAKLIHADQGVASILDRALKILQPRRLVVAEGGVLIIPPGERPLLEFYANSIRHLLPAPPGGPDQARHPALEPDPTLPRLRPRA